MKNTFRKKRVWKLTLTIDEPLGFGGFRKSLYICARYGIMVLRTHMTGWNCIRDDSGD